MSQTSKIVLGIITIIPTLLAGFILVSTLSMVMGMVAEMPNHHDVAPTFLFGNLFTIISLSIAAGTLSLGLIIYYIVHTLSNRNIDKNMQVVWILILIFTSTLGSIVYWYMNIWRDQSELTSDQTVRS